MKAELKLERREAKLRRHAERDQHAESAEAQPAEPSGMPERPEIAEPKKLVSGHAGSKYMKLRRQVKSGVRPNHHGVDKARSKHLASLASGKAIKGCVNHKIHEDIKPMPSVMNR